MIVIVLSWIPAYISYISSEKRFWVSSNIPTQISEDFLCKTQGAGLCVCKWKILIRNKTINETVVIKETKI